MKHTGIIRRLDDLGRIVIPRELRRTMRVQEGDPFELNIMEIEGKNVFVLEPYHSLENLKCIQKGVQKLAEQIAPAGDNCVIAVIDNFGLVYSSHNRSDHTNILDVLAKEARVLMSANPRPGHVNRDRVGEANDILICSYCVRGFEGDNGNNAGQIILASRVQFPEEKIRAFTLGCQVMTAMM